MPPGGALRAMTRISTERKVALGFVLPLACLGVIGVVAYLSVERVTVDADWVRHTYEVLASLDSVADAIAEAESMQARYVITGDDSFRDASDRAAAAASDLEDGLAELTRDNPSQQVRVQSLKELTEQRVTALLAVVQLRATRGFEAAQHAVQSDYGRQIHARIRGLMDEMKQAEQSLLTEREMRSRESRIGAYGVIIGGGAVALAIVALALLAVRRDFAGRARAEQALRDANDQLERRVEERTAELRELAAIVASSEDAIMSKSLTGIITSWNPGAERLFGYTAGEILGRSMAELFPPELQSEETELLSRVARGEVVDHFETQRVRKDGTRVDVSASLSPLRNSAGEIVGASSIARDISERKQAEHKVRTQLERLNLLHRITRAIGERQDLPGILQIVARTVEENLPLDFASLSLYESSNGTLVVRVVGSKRGPFETGRPITEGETVPIDRNGLSRCMSGELVYEPDVAAAPFSFPQSFLRCGLRSLVIAPLRVESKALGVLAVARQAPEAFSSGDCEFLRQLGEHVALAARQAQLHEDLQAAYDDLRKTRETVFQQERLRAVSEMASGIAHDINNAISPVSIYTDILLARERGLTDVGRNSLLTIRESIAGVAQTIARLREFCRPREAPLAATRLSLNPILEQVKELTRVRWRDQMQQQGTVIDCRLETADDLPDLMGVENEIRDAVTNLVFNAIDAMPDGGVLTLRTTIAANAPNGVPSGTRVYVEVADTGLGMDEETRQRCIDPFYTTKGERGTGLGLSMVYGMAQRHNAVLEIDSAPGEGTTVRLKFPIAGDTVMSAAETSAAGAAVRSLRVLIIDDDPLLAKALRDALEIDGHAVTSADGGQNGIEEFTRARATPSPFDVVISDLGMPHVDGRKVAAAVKAQSPDTPMILLTGWGSRLIADNDKPQHVDRVLSKPPQLAELREALFDLMAARASGESMRAT